MLDALPDHKPNGETLRAATDLRVHSTGVRELNAKHPAIGIARDCVLIHPRLGHTVRRRRRLTDQPHDVFDRAAERAQIS